MKLRMPKSLLAFIMLAFVAFPAYAETGGDITQIAESGDMMEEDEIEPMKTIDLERVDSPVGDGESYHYEVGAQTTKQQDNVTWYGNLELANKDTVGFWSGSQLQTGGFGSYYEGKENGKYTNRVTIDGDLKLSGESQVALGGQYRKKGFLTTTDYYSGIRANAVSVEGNATLISDSANFTSLSASGTSTVSLHTSQTGGNNWSKLLGWISPDYTVMLDPGHKMTVITGAISVEDSAQVTIGVDNGQFGTYKTDHYLSCLGGTITQDTSSEEDAALSTLAIKGKTYISGMLNLTQNGGTMEIGLKADSSGSQKALVYLSSGVENKITQNGAGTLTIGKLVKGLDAAENSQIIISQTGSGILNMDNGVDFTSAADKTSSITQSGGGTINLSGDYAGADFKINQTKGTMNLYGSMDLVGAENNFGGTLAVSDESTLKADSMSVGGTLTNDGTVQATGQVTATGTVNNNKNLAVQSLVINSGTTTNAKGATLTAGSITVDGGTLINYGTISSASGTMMLAEGDDIAAIADSTSNLITIASGKMEQYGVTTDNILVKDGGTLTLGVVEGVTTNTSVGAVTLEDGANMIVAGNSKTGALTLEGGKITFVYGATLSSASATGIDKVEITVNLSDAALADIKAGNGFEYELFTNSTGTNLAGKTVNFLSTSGGTGTATVMQDSNGKVTVGQLVPEPTTATMSLLALAALAARRRRRK